MKNRHLKCAVGIAACLLLALLPTVANATLIAVPYGDFSTVNSDAWTTITTNVVDTTTVTGWTVTTNVAGGAVSVGGFPNAGAHGVDFATDTAGNAWSLSQTLTTDVVAHTVYTLGVDVSKFPSNIPLPVTSIQLRVNGVELPGGVKVNPAPVDGPSGSWDVGTPATAWTATYSTGASVPSGALEIVFQMATSTLPSGYNFVVFDNVTLDAVTTEVPEPASLALLGLGGLLVVRIRRR